MHAGTYCLSVCLHPLSWIGYEKEGFRGHQYLLEEGEYHDWTQWGGYNNELVSLRLIRTVRTASWIATSFPHTSLGWAGSPPLPAHLPQPTSECQGSSAPLSTQSLPSLIPLPEGYHSVPVAFVMGTPVPLGLR